MFEQHQTFHRIAERVSARLLADLKAGKMPKIGIDEIRAALPRDPEYPRGADIMDLDRLEEMTTRRLVTKVV
jgi:hypothetical protein